MFTNGGGTATTFFGGQVWTNWAENTRATIDHNNFAFIIFSFLQVISPTAFPFQRGREVDGGRGGVKERAQEYTKNRATQQAKRGCRSIPTVPLSAIA
ncbi:hypothetical protein A2789_04315 [Candidatus Peribacteria bacterium RIFCSPHIGHO2_01_FULL_54_22]|nr:MAG: hypothetical protein A2789_04315 [Candidatus Peribacteria bacterium RIFCSPHIGHO2_01_FULL_54_22]